MALGLNIKHKFAGGWKLGAYIHWFSGSAWSPWAKTAFFLKSAVSTDL